MLFINFEPNKSLRKLLKRKSYLKYLKLEDNTSNKNSSSETVL